MTHGSLGRWLWNRVLAIIIDIEEKKEVRSL